MVFVFDMPDVRLIPAPRAHFQNKLHRYPWCVRTVLLLCALMCITAPASAAVRANPEPALAALYDAILPHFNRDALVLYVVPVATEGENKTEIPGWWRHCPYSKTVSEAGATQARQIAAALRGLRVRVAWANSAEICASLTTATYVVADPAVRVHPTPDLNPPELLRLSGLKNGVIETLVRASVEVGVAGAVAVVSGSPLTLETAPYPVLADMQAGDSSLFVLGRGGEVRLLAKLTPTQWGELMNYARSKRGRKP